MIQFSALRPQMCLVVSFIALCPLFPQNSTVENG
nr:MAG TPA: hypothetical protein [Caudoviricetes sp.]